MSAPLTLYLARHGDVHNPDGILYGRMPNFRLSELGREQAQAAGKWLAEQNPVRLYASPMQRAQETAGIIRDALATDPQITTEERINECHTPYDGTSHAELEEINFDLYTGTEPPYEQPRDLRRRLVAFVQDMRKKHAGETIAAVSHGDIVVSAFMWAKEQDENDIGRSKTEMGRYQALGLPEVYPATASISKLVFQTENPDEIPAYTYIRPY